VYFADDDAYGGRFTVPVLYDKQEKKIVNNESSEIIRMLNAEFSAFAGQEEEAKIDYYPEDKKEEIDQINEWIYK